MKNLFILLIIAVGLFSCEAESFDETSFPQENNPGVIIDELEETRKPNANNSEENINSENINGIEINK